MKPEQIVEDYVKRTGVRDPERVRSGVKRKGPISMATIRATLAKLADTDILPDPKETKSKGIALAGFRVSSRKPNDGLKAQIYGLRKGHGYPVNELAKQWCVSEDSLRAQARRFECLKYVEITPGNWTPCVLHPETAETIK